MLTVAFLSIVCLFFFLCVGKLDELKAEREKKGAELIALRDQSQAAGFTDDGTFTEKWEKANEAYDSAVKAEEAEIAAEDRRNKMNAVSERVRADAERIAASNRSRFVPDYDPRQDPRARGGNNGTYPTQEEWSMAIRAFAQVRSASFDPDEETMAAVKKCRVNLHADEMNLPAGRQVMALVAEAQDVFISYHPTKKAQAIRQIVASWNTMTPDSAGYLTEPPQVIRTLEINRLAWGGLLQVATVRQTTTGEDLLLPYSDDSTVRGRRIAEDGPLGTENSPRVGLIKWGAYKYTSDIISVTYEMTRDTFIDLEGYIGEMGGMRLGRIQNYEATVGNGASMPRGVVFSAPIGVTTASSTAITTDEVIDLEESVDYAYQNGDRVGYMMHPGIRKYLRKLKDLDGRPFYQLGQETGGRDSLNGKPIFLNYDMASTAVASADVMLYGDFSKVVVRRVGGTRLVRDPYTQRISNDRELFAAVEYMDSNVVNAGTAPIKKMRMKP